DQKEFVAAHPGKGLEQKTFETVDSVRYEVIEMEIGGEYNSPTGRFGVHSVLGVHSFLAKFFENFPAILLRNGVLPTPFPYRGKLTRRSMEVGGLHFS
ncbi:MAG: hypothetical protein KC931_13095, partial [Candidatus Omnitrophica bacterium]|nr:hypothetical protein [Candidatus Omnitrophota bacterium]